MTYKEKVTNKEKVICIVGPTGIGKTKLSIALAKALKSEIINGDAIQIFKEGDILSAKPSLEEREGIVHYLLDDKDLDYKLDIASFKEEASSLITTINNKGMIPIVVGGSGLYLKALLYDYNLDQIKSKSSEIESKYQDYSNEALFDVLVNLDAQAASILHPNNRKRVLRGIDIALNNEVNKTDFINSQNKEVIYDALIIGLQLERDKLYERINYRVDVMSENGLLDEVTSLVDKYGYDKDYQLFQAIGFKEFIPYLKNESSLSEVLDKIKQNSRRYAKKQLTWFHNQMQVDWIDVDLEDFDKTIKQALLLVEEKYGKDTV